MKKRKMTLATIASDLRCIGSTKMVVAASPALDLVYAAQSGAESLRFILRGNGDCPEMSIHT